MQLLDESEPIVSAADSDDWPDAFLDACHEAELITLGSDAHFIRCPNCDDPHDVEVRDVRVHNELRFIATCPHTGVVLVPRRLVRQWRPSMAGFARLIARGIGVHHEPSQILGDNAWEIGYLVRHGRALRVCLVRGAPDWGRLAQPNTLLAVILVTSRRIADAPTDVVPVRLDSVVSWAAAAGIVFNSDLLYALLNTAGEHAGGFVKDGFQPPDKLVFNGTLHQCPNLKPQLQKLLSHLATREAVPIRDLVYKGQDAVWFQEWNASDKKLVQAIRSALNELKNQLARATPSLKIRFTLQTKCERIIRRGGC